MQKISIYPILKYWIIEILKYKKIEQICESDQCWEQNQKSHYHLESVVVFVSVPAFCSMRVVQACDGESTCWSTFCRGQREAAWRSTFKSVGTCHILDGLHRECDLLWRHYTIWKVLGLLLSRRHVPQPPRNRASYSRHYRFLHLLPSLLDSFANLHSKLNGNHPFDAR